MIRQFFYVAAALLIAKFISIVTQILMGRFGGPDFYGQITLILLLANIFSLPMSNGWGLAYVREVAAKRYQDNAVNPTLKALLYVVLIATAFTTLILLFVVSSLSAFLNIPEASLYFAIVLAIISAFWLLSKQIFQAEKLWGQYVLIEAIWVLLVFIGLCFIFLNNLLLIPIATLVFAVSYFLALLPASKKVLRAAGSTTSTPLLKAISGHGLLLLVNSMVGLLVIAMDRVIINQSLGVSEVGIYQAHFLATYGIVSTLIAILINYLFPIFASDQGDGISSYTNRVILYAYPLISVLTFFMGWIVVSLYSYPLSWPLLFFLSAYSAFYFHGQVVCWQLASKGVETTRYILFIQIISLAINIFVLYATIGRFGIISGGLALLISSMIYAVLISRPYFSGSGRQC